MPEWAELRRKPGQRGLLITSYKRLKKDSDRAIIPVAEEVHVPAHLAPPGSLHTKQLYHFHAQLSLGQSCYRQKILVSMHAGSLQLSPTRHDLVDCGLTGFSCQEGSPGKNIGVYWPILVAIPF